MPETASEFRPDDGRPACLPWLLRLGPAMWAEQPCRPNWFWRLNQWLFFGYTWEPNPSCPLPGYAPRRPEPGGDDDPGWMRVRRTLVRTPAGVVLRYA